MEQKGIATKNNKESRPSLEIFMISYGCMFVEGASGTILVGLMGILAMKFGCSTGDIATLISIRNLSALFIAALAGKIADRFGRRIPIIMGTLLYILFFAGFILTSNYSLAIIFAISGGLAGSLVDVPGFSLLFDATLGNTGPTMSLVEAFFAGGAAFANAMAALFMKAHWDYRLIFLILLILDGLILFLALRASYPPISGSLESEKEIVYYREKPKFRREGIWIMAITLASTCYVAMLSTWLPTYMEGAKELSSVTSVGSLSLYQLGTVIGSMIYYFILKKLHSSQVLAISPVLTAVAFFSLLQGKSQLSLLLIVLLLGLINGSYYALIINMASELFYDQAGVAAGAVSTINWIVFTLVAYVVGRMLPSLGIEKFFYFSFVAVLIHSALALTFRLHYKKLIEPVELCDEKNATEPKR